MLMLARKLTNYRLHMVGITKNKQKCLIFIVDPQGKEILIRLYHNGRVFNTKKTVLVLITIKIIFLKNLTY